MIHFGYYLKSIRSLGIRVTDLMPDGQPIQLEFDVDKSKRRKLEKLDQTVDWLKNRYGNLCIQRATLLIDRDISKIDAKKDNVIHPVSYFGNGT